MQRRSFLSLTLAGVSGWLADRLPDGGLRIDGEPLDQLGTAITRLRYLDARDGAASVIAATQWLAGRLNQALANTPPEHEEYLTLASLTADASEQAGWVAYDTGEYGGALRCYDLAIDAARKAKDPNFLVFAGEERAKVLWRGRGDTGAALAQLKSAQLESVELGPLSPQVRGLLHAARGRILAAKKDEPPMHRAMEAAASAARSSSTESPSWLGWSGSPADIDGGHGLALASLGYGDKAAELLTSALRRLPPQKRRLAGTVHRGLAQAAVLTGEPDRAALHVVRAHEIFTATKSRQLGELRAVVVDLRARYGDVREVRDLDEQLRATPKPDGDAGWRYEISSSRRGGKGLHLRTCPQLKLKRGTPGKERHEWFAGAGRDPADVARDPAVRARFNVCKTCLPG